MWPLGILKKPIDPTLAMLHFAGAHGTKTPIIDSSHVPLQYTNQGEAFIFTSNSKFGGSSLFANFSSGKGVISASDPRFALSNHNFTLECWIRDERYQSGTLSIIGVGNKQVIAINQGVLRACVFDGFTYFEIIHQTTINALTWVHVALVRNNGVITLYVNGVPSTNTIAIGTTPLVNSNFLELAAREYKGTLILGFESYIDEVRLRREAMYTSAFTPPTAPFTT